MFGLSLSHLIILAVVILLFGARRLPELGSALGKGIRAFKRGIDGTEEDPSKRIADDDSNSGDSNNKKS